MVIYKITNKINSKFYIGSTINFDRRIKDHFRRLKNNNHHSIKLQNSYNKYGEENFIVEILEYVSDINNLISSEQKWMDSENPTLNVTLIAGLNSHIGLKRSDETRLKISESLKGKSPTIETRNKIRETLTGRKLTEEHKENIKSGKENSETFLTSLKSTERIEKIKETRIKNGGYIITDDMKIKISETLKSKNLQSAISIIIEKYSLEGELIDTYPSILKAERDNNIGRCGIYNNIIKNNKTEYKGFIWKIIK
jgi:group I intron endonuclease